MKKRIFATIIAIALSNVQQAQAAHPVNDELNTQSPLHTAESNTKTTRNELVGFGSGAIAGTFVGGPLGGIVGGIVGIFMANDINQDNEIAQQEDTLIGLHRQLSAQTQAFQSLQQQYAQLEQSQMIQLASIDTKVTSEWLRDLPSLESNVQFKTASFLVDDAFKGQLKSLAGLLNQYPNLRVQLNGYADARGDSNYNRILSEQRAQSVKDFLVQQRVNPTQIIAQGQGEIELVNAQLSNQVESLFFDRRVTLKLITNQSAMTAAN